MNRIRWAIIRTKLSPLGLVLVIAASFLIGTLVPTALTQTRSRPAPILPRGPVLTGAWKADDGGIYYIRQIGNTVWWAGLSGDGGRSFTNVFQGTREGSLIVGNWADVPQGQILGGGSLTLSINATSQGIELRRHSETGGFGGSIWQRGAATQQSATDTGATRTMLADGTVEIVSPDGVIHRYHRNGDNTTVQPDGTTTKKTNPITGIIIGVQQLTPPLSVLSQPNVKPWLERHNKGLLNIIEGLFTAEKRKTALANLQNAEQGMTLYQQIDFRAGAIARLRK